MGQCFVHTMFGTVHRNPIPLGPGPRILTPDNSTNPHDPRFETPGSVTHSMQQAARVSQKTAFFHMGEVVESGETGQIFTDPRDERTQAYITGRIG